MVSVVNVVEVVECGFGGGKRDCRVEGHRPEAAGRRRLLEARTARL